MTLVCLTQGKDPQEYGPAEQFDRPMPVRPSLPRRAGLGPWAVPREIVGLDDVISVTSDLTETESDDDHAVRRGDGVAVGTEAGVGAGNDAWVGPVIELEQAIDHLLADVHWPWPLALTGPRRKRRRIDPTDTVTHAIHPHSDAAASDGDDERDALEVDPDVDATHTVAHRYTPHGFHRRVHRSQARTARAASLRDRHARELRHGLLP